jgi:hypothetical protein
MTSRTKQLANAAAATSNVPAAGVKEEAGAARFAAFEVDGYRDIRRKTQVREYQARRLRLRVTYTAVLATLVANNISQWPDGLGWSVAVVWPCYPPSPVTVVCPLAPHTAWLCTHRVPVCPYTLAAGWLRG